jgi:hypothetical protein
MDPEVNQPEGLVRRQRQRDKEKVAAVDLAALWSVNPLNAELAGLDSQMGCELADASAFTIASRLSVVHEAQSHAISL